MAKGLIELPLQGTIDTHTAARIAGVTESTVRRWCDEGNIEAWKPAGRWRIDRDLFLVFMSKPGSVAAPAVAAPVRKTIVAVPPSRKRPVPAATLPLFPE